MLNNYNLEKIYYAYLMGAHNSQYELEDWNTPRLGYSLDKRLSYWDYQDKPKNFDYWFSKDRFTYISREHYKNNYVKGYLWGRYEIKNSLDNNINETETEDVENEIKTFRRINQESNTKGYNSDDYEEEKEEEEERSF
jgi:hypothetical protein